jgi:serine/threonine protein phosphatase 1
MERPPRYYVEGNTIFVHAGIDEEAGDLWEWGTGEEIFVGKYPAETGKIEGLDMKVVAGHIGTAVISGDPDFHDIYYDGQSHYYIDGTVLDSGIIPILMVDTSEDKYYSVTEAGDRIVLPYDEEN